MTGKEKRGIAVGPSLAPGLDLNIGLGQDRAPVPALVHAQKGFCNHFSENYSKCFIA